MKHTHKYRPKWVLLTSPAWEDHYHRIIAHVRCILCGQETYVSAWQSPGHLNWQEVEDALERDGERHA